MRQALAALMTVAVLAGCGADEPSESALEAEAFDVCTRFVKDRLQGQSTAEFPDPSEDDGQVVFAHTGDHRWKVTSQVDAQNALGGTVTTPFVCVVENTDGDRWRLASLTFD